MSDKYILVEGNPLSGFNFYGPFDNEAAAVRYAERDPEDDEWWVADLLEPIDEEDEVLITVNPVPLTPGGNQ